MRFITVTSAVQQLATLLMLWGLQGCSAENSAVFRPMPTPPDELQIDSTAWQRQSEMTEGDQRLLTSYLRLQPSVAENPLLHGKPSVYRSPAGGRRFYWLSQTDTEVHWVFLGFRRGRFMETQAGTGPPFVSAAE
ncbi:hypothetical protein CA54_22690 [Symmachiella macrocystis]|uniref:Lipoprotein n=1 Tax=Symmachiella macrocystis TaxID=2527985 RepID=A0A5C6BRX7_9PLAN|nr:hypothetical protein [Symmachiella macrocystis]TWU13434.1 hypothetical protein CA54_22690 [Symmachiella macrocystis]